MSINVQLLICLYNSHTCLIQTTHLSGFWQSVAKALPNPSSNHYFSSLWNSHTPETRPGVSTSNNFECDNTINLYSYLYNWLVEQEYICKFSQLKYEISIKYTRKISITHYLVYRLNVRSNFELVYTMYRTILFIFTNFL